MKVMFQNRWIALSLECHVLPSVVCGSLFSRIRSRNNSFLSIFATCFIVFYNCFSWKPRIFSFANLAKICEICGNLHSGKFVRLRYSLQILEGIKNYNFIDRKKNNLEQLSNIHIMII